METNPCGGRKPKNSNESRRLQWRKRVPSRTHNPPESQAPLRIQEIEGDARNRIACCNNISHHFYTRRGRRFFLQLSLRNRQRDARGQATACIRLAAPMTACLRPRGLYHRGIARPLVRIDGCRCARTLYCRLRCLPLFTSGLPADSRLRSGPANEPTLTRSSTTTSALRLQRRRQGLFCPTAGEKVSRERDCLPLLGASCA